MAVQVVDAVDRITRDPAVMVGKPVVRGTRIPVERVLEQLAYKPDLDELLAMFPDLTEDDVKACLAYAQAAVEEKCRPVGRAVAPGVAGAATG